jgi:hypothetical protein
MRLTDVYRRCVVFIGYQFEDRFSARGTAFLVRVETLGSAFDHLVTARHNIEMIEHKYEELGVPEADRSVVIRVNKEGGGVEFAYSKLEHWLTHPDESSYIDVAVIPVIIVEADTAGPGLAVRAFQQGEFVTDEVVKSLDLMPGAPIATVGLFTSHFGATRNIPVVRTGNIAMMRDPGNMVETKRGYMDAYLVEVRSLGGLSGSPVLVPSEPFWMGDDRKIKKPFAGQKAAYLLGLVHGHFVLRDENDIVREIDEQGDNEALSEDELNAGIAVVVPVDKILETINQTALVEAREEVVRKRRKESGVREDSTTTAKSISIKDGDKKRFDRLLGEAVKRPKSSDQT